MSDAERDPHVLVSARIGSNEKLLALPSHRARWGWIVMLGQAKLQRPPGVFTSIAQVRFLAGEFRDCVSHWIDVRLLHAGLVARECQKCAAAYPTIEDPWFVVHNFRDHQERKSRTTLWREENGVPNGHVNLTGNQPGNDRGNNGETTSLAGAPVRAHAGALHSLSQSPSLETTGGPGGLDFDELTLFAFIARNGAAIRPDSGFGRRLLGLVSRRGASIVMAKAMTLAKGGALSDRQWVFGLEQALEDVPDPKAAAAAEDQAKRAAKRDAAIWQRRIEAYRAGGGWDPAWGEPPPAA